MVKSEYQKSKLTSEICFKDATLYYMQSQANFNLPSLDTKRNTDEVPEPSK